MNVSDGTDTRNRFFYRDLSKLPIGAPAGASDARIKQAERTVRERSDRLEEAGKISDPTLIAKEESIIEAESLARKNLVTKGGNTAYGFVELLNDFDASYDFIGNDGPTFYFRTDLEAPRGRVIAINVNHPERSAWQELVPQGAETLQGVSFVGGRFLASYLKDAQTQIRAFDTAGKAMGEVKLPGIGTAGGFGGKRGEMETFYSFASFTTPTTIYHYDIASGQSSVFKQPKVGFTGAEYQTRQVFVSSKDGTRVPMFITCKKDTKLDGSTPCMLYGYGGFNISLTPGFSPGNAVWLEMGGIYAVANLRGGGEYGEEWHQAGTKTRKQNVFDDFIACAEYLVKEKYTSTPKLAISGGSNGGLLVGACITQRPELFGAALPAVGVLDMLRFHRFTIGRAWCSDYGCAEGEDPAEFKALMAYSPLHNLRSGACYPTTMITTADHDDRVVPAHSFKFAAAIQAAQSCPNPVLIRIETKAGHGAGKPTAKVIEEKADQWAFLVRALDFVPTIKGGSAAAPKVSPSR
ncbi:MAG: S9 family peptidase [Phycisphaerales bacterium]|nr:S9 family peptidase [Phycisphaerales bacterium]